MNLFGWLVGSFFQMTAKEDRWKTYIYISPFCSQLFDKALQLHEEIDKSLGMPHETFESWVGQHRPYLASIGPTSPASARKIYCYRNNEIENC